MKTELHVLCEQLVGSSLNGVYQGILLSILVGGLLRLWGRDRVNATTRHGVWFFSLLLVVLMLPGHYLLERRTARAIDLVQKDFSAPDSTRVAPNVNSIAPGLTALQFDLAHSFESGALDQDAPIVEADSPSRQGDTDANQLGFSSQALGLVAQEGQGAGLEVWRRIRRGLGLVGGKFLQPFSRNIESMLSFPLVAALTCLWFVIAGSRVIMLAVQLLRLRKLLKGSTLPTFELNVRFTKLRAEVGAGRGAGLRISLEHNGPLVLGFFKPVILLPVDLAEPSKAAEVEHVLRHELAHVRRYDDWANLIQHFIQAILFFHPAVLWIGKCLSLEREIACDDHALERGIEKRSYALTLANVACRLRQKTPMLAPGVSNNHSQLEQRINMILNTRRNNSPRLAKGRLASVLSLAALGAFFALYACPRLVLAATSADSSVAAIDTDTVTPTPTPSVKVSIDPVRVKVTSKVDLASADAPSQGAVGIGAGPKLKPENPDAEPAPPTGVEPPEMPDVPGIDAARHPPRPPRAARLGRPGKGPQPPDFPDTLNGADSSIEDRLNRLEKMVRALLDQQGVKHPREAFGFRDGNDNFNLDQKQIDKMEQMAERQAQRAAEQAERATRDLESQIQQQNGKAEFRESFQNQLESMRKAREGLSRELERLDRQIKRLQQDQERVEKDRLHDRSDADGAQPDLRTPEPDK